MPHNKYPWFFIQKWEIINIFENVKKKHNWNEKLGCLMLSNLAAPWHTMPNRPYWYPSKPEKSLSDAKMLPNARTKNLFFSSHAFPLHGHPPPLPVAVVHRQETRRGIDPSPPSTYTPLIPSQSFYLHFVGCSQIVLEKNSMGTCPFKYPTFNLWGDQVWTNSNFHTSVQFLSICEGWKVGGRHTWYLSFFKKTTPIWGQEILHLKVRKVVSWQNCQ